MRVTRAFATLTVLAACSTTNVTNVYVTGSDGGDAALAEGGDAGNGDASSPVRPGDAAGIDGQVQGPSCSSPVTVDDTGLQQCASCTPDSSCTAAEPLDACCTWVASPTSALADGIGLHRYSTSSPSAVPDLSCLVQPGTLGVPQTVTLTGYLWLFASGQDSTGVQVDVYAENHPETPDGTIGSTSLGTYTTTTSDPIDPTDTTWDTECPNGCSFRQYTIANVPTETPLVIRTSDAGSGKWVTRYEYDVYFSNAAVVGGEVAYDATAMAAEDVQTVTGAVGLTSASGTGHLVGEVHDCSDIRLSGATVETSPAPQNGVFYFTADEADPVPLSQATGTSDLGLFAAFNMQAGIPTRVTAVGQCPPSAASAICNQGDYVMLGTYVVQTYPGAVTALALRGRRPWQL